MVPEKFSFVGLKNNTEINGNWTILTGNGVNNDVMKIIEWNRQDKLSTEFITYGLNDESKSCSQLRGGDGIKFHSGVTKEETLFLFMPGDICTAFPFKFDSYSSIKGIKTLRFRMKFNEAHESLSCFSPKGFLWVGLCKDRVPVYATGAHFYGGDQDLLNGIQGLSPDKSLHESFIDVEPLTGFVLRASLRFQINVNVSRMESMPTSNLKFPHRLLPIFSIDTTAEADEYQLQRLNEKLFEKLGYLTYFCWLCVILGGISALFLLHRSQSSLRDVYPEKLKD